MSTHLQLANSTTMAILCGITILIVLLQPVIFMIVAFKRGKELNMTDQEMKEAAHGRLPFCVLGWRGGAETAAHRESAWERARAWSGFPLFVVLLFRGLRAGASPKRPESPYVRQDRLHELYS